MKERSTKRKRGFSLLEMTIAMALGTVVLGAAVQLYSQGVSATWVVSQRAEMQQDFRAASNMLVTDLSLAGAGLGDNSQVALVKAAKSPAYGCDQTKCYINAVAQPYPKQGATPYLYGLVPGYQIGPTLNAAQGATDVVSVVYTDPNFFINCYTAKVTSGTVVLFQLPSPLPTTCVLPASLTAPQALNDSVFGLTAGDVILFTLTTGGTTTQIVTEVTAAPVVTSPGSGYSAAYNVTFANNDALLLNQSPATSGTLGNVAVNTLGSGTRILITSYYIDNAVSPPRLMRQVSGHTPMPVAENVVYLQFTYDSFANGTVYVDSGDANATENGLTPNQITKINIKHMAMDSTIKSGLSGSAKGFQSMDLQTSVSGRDLTYRNGFPIGP